MIVAGEWGKNVEMGLEFLVVIEPKDQQIRTERYSIKFWNYEPA